MSSRTNRLARLFAAPVVGGLILATANQTGSAQLPSSINNGRILAERLCTSCHVIGESTSRVVKADVPSFIAIANRPNQTAERIAGRLIDPHPPMPRISLTRNEITHLAAYILSLKK